MVYYLAGGIGSAIAGGIWSAEIPRRLTQLLGDPALAASAYDDPFTFASTYPIGTPERIALQTTYNEIQRKILIVSFTCTATNRPKRLSI